MKVKKNIILLEASQIKEYMEKKKKIPKACTLSDGTVLSPYSTSYLIGNLIKNINSSQITLTNVIVYNADKHADTINEKVVKDDYLFMITNFLNFCVDHKRVPSYITTKKSKVKVSFELFMYCLSKIANFYKENNTLPNYCEFKKSDLQNTATSANTNKNSNSQSTSSKQNTNNCNNPYKSVPYTTKPGCDELGQNTNYYCGVSALQKCLYKFGIHISQKTLAQWAGTTTKGTDHRGLETAIANVAKTHNVKLSCKWYNYSELGLEGVAKILCQPNKDVLWHLLYRLEYGHYEKVAEINTKTQKLKVMNSLGNKCSNGCFCGYIEERTAASQKSYCSGISQKSILVITKG